MLVRLLELSRFARLYHAQASLTGAAEGQGVGLPRFPPQKEAEPSLPRG